MTIGEDTRAREGGKMAVQTSGLAWATPVLQLHGGAAHGRVVLRKRLRRTNLFACLADLPRCLLGMAAGRGAP